MFQSDFPKAPDGQRIGLLGGSFDPAHQGHVHITLQALKRFELDYVWWLVSPGNPLKPRGPAPLAARMAQAAALMRHPRVKITDLEAHLGTVRTAETLTQLRARIPRARFVWLMGADNLARFHLWQDWQNIMNTVPVGVIARPGERISARMSVAARLFAPYRVPGRASHRLGLTSAPAWCFVNVPMSALSSTQIRAGVGSAAQQR